MKFTAAVFTIGLLASQSIAQPMAEESAPVEAVDVESRDTASGCNYYSAPRCCVPSVCQCRDGRIYQLNQNAMNGGRHGCDPPWGLISNHLNDFPGYCC